MAKRGNVKFISTVADCERQNLAIVETRLNRSIQVDFFQQMPDIQYLGAAALMASLNLPNLRTQGFGNQLNI